MRLANKRIGIVFVGLVVSCLAVATVQAEDGYRLWLRYDAVPEPTVGRYRTQIRAIVVPGKSPTAEAIRTELSEGCAGLLGGPVPKADTIAGDGSLLVGTPE